MQSRVVCVQTQFARRVCDVVSHRLVLHLPRVSVKHREVDRLEQVTVGL